MASANIEVTLHGGESVGLVKRYQPGEVMHGDVLVVPEDNFNCRRLIVRLQWHTEGRGNRDKGVADEQVLFRGEMKQGMPYQHSFQFILPNEPWSYAGHYINIVWEVVVVIDVPMSFDPNAAFPFVLSPLPVAE